eukprot:442122_1
MNHDSYYNSSDNNQEYRLSIKWHCHTPRAYEPERNELASFEKFKKYWKRKTNYKGFWCIDKETRRFIASAVIDRYLYDQQHQEKYDDDLNEKLEELFKELQEKRLPIDLTNEPDECVSDIDILE